MGVGRCSTPICYCRPVADMREIGTYGYQRSGGAVTDEFVASLQGLRGARTYREMADNDPVIGAMLFAVERMILNLKWHVDPYKDAKSPKAAKKDEKVALFVEECLGDMEESWSSTLSQILSFLTYGWSYCEIVYKKRGGMDAKDKRKQSEFDDGKIGWRRLANRAQETLFDWDLAPNGDILGMRQLDPSSNMGLVTIPIEKSLLFRTTNQRNSPEGRSLLRNAYRPWRFKKTIEEIEAIGIERDLAGLPVAYVPPSMLSSTATSDEVAARNAIQNLVRGIKRNQNEGILFPLAFDEGGREMYKLTLLSSGGNRQFNTDAVVGRYDQRIAMTILADFILLGHEKVGSFALGSSKIDLFMTAIAQMTAQVADVMNKDAIPRLLKMNGMDPLRPPTLRVEELQTTDLQVLGDFITKMAGAGALQVDAGLDQFVRDLVGLPPKVEEEGAMGMGAEMMPNATGDQPVPAAAPPQPAPAVPAQPAAETPMTSGGPIEDYYSN